jgi:hypothetical protein
MLAACGSSDDIANTVSPDGPVSGDEQSKVSLAFSVSSTAAQTRSSAEMVQVSGFRGITTPTLLAFQVRREVQKDDKAYPASVSGASGIDGKNAKFFFYNDFQLPIGTSALLVYAKATPVNDKAVNGSTISTIPTNTNPAAITFSPDCIYSGTTVHADAQAIADYLTAIANTPNWEGSSYDELRQNFIGKGAVAPTLIAGSSASVNAYVDKLIVELNKSGDSQLKTDIITNINNKPVQLTDATKYYPASIGLPDGVAALKWVETTTNNVTTGAFVPQTTTTLQGVNSLNVFAYPAELCYYGNSQIKTSESLIGHTGYTSATDWKENVLPNYTDGQIITSTTKSVAIENPLQYGVARLDVTIQAKTTKLKDSDGTDITVGATSFPLTGIIVGGQRRVGFDYKPLNSADAQSLVYDSQVKKDNNSSAYLLSTAPTATDAVHTLLLQSLDGEDETIILEFENNCKDGDNNGVTFKGIDGMINPGTKFYLIGTILKPTEEEGKDYTKRVFTQDYITSANITIESLSHAYNAVPDLYYDALTSFHVVNIDIKPWSESSTSHSVYNW